ncbi:MAG: hypothetical protein PSV22_16595 [Pseudolabrys sp.]|nr:hypothetical protein [Pseudolabrys sp.]
MQGDRIADALILQFIEFGVVNFLGGVAAKRLAQNRRPQQAANMIGAERGAAFCRRSHGEFSLGLIIL